MGVTGVGCPRQCPDKEQRGEHQGELSHPEELCKVAAVSWAPGMKNKRFPGWLHRAFKNETDFPTQRARN